MILADLSLEQDLYSRGFRHMAGLDEVGRGSWVGPIVAAAVILPRNWALPPKLTDSKLLKPSERAELDLIIRSQALAFSIAEVGLGVINRSGIGPANHLALRRALRGLKLPSDFQLVDGFKIRGLRVNSQMAVIHGDQKSASIAAASILAKVYRDQLMRRLSEQFPDYGWSQNKGYGTASHQAAIKRYGLTSAHRTSFRMPWLVTDLVV